MIRWRTCILVALFAGAIAASAQVERVLPRKGSSSLEGTEFVIGFMQNELLEFGVDPRLQIFISSQFDAIVTIEYPLFGPQVRRVAANTVFVENVSPYHVVNASEQPTQKGIFIRSNVPIVVYTLNTLAASTDSYTAIPIKHLGNEYLTVNRPNDRYPINPREVEPLDTMIRSSEFMVIAPNDFTNVEITPSYRTERGSLAGEPINVTLYRGQCYVVRSAQTPIGTGDLTGSRIRSNLPVAVLSGHVRASVPTDTARSKDHLVEMLPPLPKWGKMYATTPFAIVYGGDIVRLMAGTDDTNIEIETPAGPFTRYLAKAGDWVDLTLNDPAFYKSSKPFLVTQFMPSRRNGGSTDYDPAMVIVPPIEQYVTGALLQFPLLERQQQLGAYQNFYHFINLVAEDIAVASLRVNDRLVRDIAPRITTQSIPGTNLKWAQVQLAPGSYTVTADSGLFSGIMYGTTNADSYANLIAVSYDPIPQDDRTPPVYALSIDCGAIDGTVTDQGRDTARLTELTVQAQRTFNYRWSIDGPIDTVGTRSISASVRDLWQDGQFVVHAYDHKGNGKEWLFVYDAPDIDVPAQVQVDAVGMTRNCQSMVIHNRDTTPVTIKAITIAGDVRLSIDGGSIADVTVPALDSLVILVCMQPTLDIAPAVGTITVDIGCGRVKTTTVRSSSLARIETSDHDFGPVRIGDTVCTDLPFVNIGSVPIIMSEWFADTVRQEFIVEHFIVPDTLMPGDTVWITVCFTPDSLTSYRRTDSVVTEPDLGVRTTWTGRGIAPDVPDVVVDWGKRRVGLTCDTIVSISNLGEAACIVSVGASDVAAFSSTAFNGEVFLAGLQQDDIDLRFAPSQEGIFEDTVFASVDWRYHSVVRVILRGVGILPRLSVSDIDMGDVVVNTTKDSVAAFLQTSGTEPTTVFTSSYVGPDDAAFVIPDTLRRLGMLDTSSEVRGLIRFTPDRLGPFRMAVILEHDAAPGSARRLDTIDIIGNGVPVPFRRLEADLDLTPVLACTTATFPLRLENSGNLPLSIDSITVRFVDQSVMVGGMPILLRPGEAQTVNVTVTPTRGSSGAVVGDVYQADTVLTTFTGILEVATQPPTLQIDLDRSVAAGSTVEFRVRSIGQWPRNVSEPLEFVITAPKDRLHFTDRQVSVNLLDAVLGTTTVIGEVMDLPDGVKVALSDNVTSSYQVDFTLNAIALWKDAGLTEVSATCVDNLCGDAASAKTSFSVEECASNLRVIRFGALPMVKALVASQPASEELSVVFDVTQSTAVDLTLYGLSGERISLAENFTLQKGISHCKFSCSGRATGVYRLVVTYGNGEEVLPVVIVN